MDGTHSSIDSILSIVRRKKTAAEMVYIDEFHNEEYEVFLLMR